MFSKAMLHHLKLPLSLLPLFSQLQATHCHWQSWSGMRKSVMVICQKHR